jgi:hypothetical protein
MSVDGENGAGGGGDGGRSTILENIDKASYKLRLDTDNVAGVHLPVFKSFTEGSQSGIVAPRVHRSWG